MAALASWCAICRHPLKPDERLTDGMCPSCYRVLKLGWSAHWWKQPQWLNRPMAEIPRPEKCVVCGQKLSEIEKMGGATCDSCKDKLIKEKKQKLKE